MTDEERKVKKAAQQKAYREARREKIAEYKRAYYEANRENIAEQAKAYREANREKIAERKRARNFRKASKTTIINHLLVHQRGKCAICHCDVIEKHHLDHIMPLALGGSNDKGNMQLLCPTCNLTKHARHPVEHM